MTEMSYRSIKLMDVITMAVFGGQAGWNQAVPGGYSTRQAQGYLELCAEEGRGGSFLFAAPPAGAAVMVSAVIVLCVEDRRSRVPSHGSAHGLSTVAPVEFLAAIFLIFATRSAAAMDHHSGRMRHSRVMTKFSDDTA